MAAGRVAKNKAVFFAALLFAIGGTILLHTNLLAFGVAVAGLIAYLLYTPLKHKSALALYVGAVAGALPAVAGYSAATGALDWYAAGLFIFMFLWQLPHFLAIARYRFDEYQAAGVPLLVRKPVSEQAKRSARIIFFSSLVVLLVACAILVVVPYV
jgi:protoheme IX farnesyltransferase